MLPSGVLLIALSLLGSTQSDPACAYRHQPSALYQKFSRACGNHDEKAARAVIESGLKPNDSDEDGNTVLCVAARDGVPGAMAELLKRGADGNAMTSYHYSVMRCAISGRNAACVAALLAEGVSANGDCDGHGYRPLMEASRLGQLEMVTLLLAKGAKVNARSDHDVDAISEATETGRADVIALLADRGAEINRIGNEGMTPLMRASLAGYPDAVKVLVEKGAKVDSQSDPYRCTALALACRADSEPGRDHLAVVKCLLAHRADPKLADKNGEAPLVDATVCDRTDIIKVLGADGRSKALDWALSKSKPATLQALLDAGVDPNEATSDGRPPLLYAIESKKDPSMVEALAHAKADVNVTRRQGLIGITFVLPGVQKPHGPVYYEYSALIAAVQSGSVPIVKTLLGAGAKRDFKDSNGKTALDLAEAAKNSEMIAVLR